MFKVAGPLWAQATAGGDNVFARLVKTGKKVLRRVFQREIDPVVGKEIPKPKWSLHAQTVQVSESTTGRLIGGLFPKQAAKTQAAELRRQAALRLIRDSRKVPVFAFVGLTLGASLEQPKNEETKDILCSGIRDLFQQYGVKENNTDESGQHFSLETLQLGQLIGKGCNAAVYEARQVENGIVNSSSKLCEADQNLYQGSSVDVEKFDEGDDISIISEDEVSTADEDDASIDLNGWNLYRVSSADDTASDEVSDSESDIVILAGDESGLQSVPDLEVDEEQDWSLVTVCPPDRKPSFSIGNATTSTDVSMETRMTADSANSNIAADEPEPAPNICGCGLYPLAVKMMFNYSVESQADRILTAMAKEMVPAQSKPTESTVGLNSQQAGLKKLPPHPNIVAMHGVFVDQMPHLPEGTEVYPSALPPRLNKDSGFGRNATMFLVMKKYTMTLREYLTTHIVQPRTRCLLFSQLLEGVLHLGNHGIAHRDLKSDNVLVDLSHGAVDSPLLAISDFGCCLADTTYGLKLPYLTRETDKGGNCALMAPEIKCAKPGKDCILDYTKADLWAAGALAYEIFGEANPFYQQFDARSYTEENLPKLSDSVPESVQRLVKMLLKRDPAERPTPAVAATAMQLLLWAPAKLHPFVTVRPIGHNALWRWKELCSWLELVTVETVCQRVYGDGISSTDLSVKLKTTFLSRVTQQDVFSVVAFE